jgi:hypothetical protein
MERVASLQVLAWLTACATLIAAANTGVFAWLFWGARTWSHAGLVVASFAFLVAGGTQCHLIQETLAGRYVNEPIWYLVIGVAILFAQIILAVSAMKMSYEQQR